MRHGKKFNHLGRKTAHRKAMLSNMACSLIEHKRINTTVAKAKALRGYVEPLITKSKNDTTHSRRTVFSYLQNKEAVAELFREVAPKVADRPGGYTRIIRTGYRLGDNAEMCMIELVDFNELYSNEGKKKTTRRSRRGGGGGGAQAAAATEEAVVADAEATEAANEEATAETQEAAPAVEEAEVVEETPAEEAAPEAEAAPAEEAPAEEPKAEAESTEEEASEDKAEDDAEEKE
ncbi:MAG: 50S ribosomal protein L17 [Fluviicola sp. XM-24bin1]|nr:MAG: 50S ribosomal protein L17 [Fluviicola sp. XM-24bin1]